MDIATLVQNLFRSLQAFWGFILSFSFRKSDIPSSSDVEAAISPSNRSSFDDAYDSYSDVLDIGILEGMNSVDTSSDQSQTPTFDSAGSPISSKKSIIYPVKTRIVDVIMKNVGDKRTHVLKSVVIRPSSVEQCSLRALIDHLPECPISSQQMTLRKMFNASKLRAVTFDTTPTYLPILESTSTIRQGRHSGHSIDDLFDLFPPPPGSMPLGIAVSTSSPAVCGAVIASASSYSSSSTSDKDVLPVSLPASSTLSLDRLSGDIFDSLVSLDTATTSPPTSPELEQLACSASTNSRESIISYYSPSMRVKPVIVDGLLYGCQGQVKSSDPSVSLPMKVTTKLRVSLSATSLRHCIRPTASLRQSRYHSISYSPANFKLEKRTSLAPRTDSVVVLHAELVLASTRVSDSSEQCSIDLDEVTRMETALKQDALGITTQSFYDISSKRQSEQSDAPHSAWRASLEAILQEFRRAQVEDLDFRELFFRDSSCYSKSTYSRSSGTSTRYGLKRTGTMSTRRGSETTVASRRVKGQRLAIMSLAEKARLRKQVCDDESEDEMLDMYLDAFAIQ